MLRQRMAVAAIAVWACVGPVSRSAGAEIPLATPAAVSDATERGQPGDVFVLADGEYRDAHLVVLGKGTPDAPITLRAATPGKAVLTGASRLSIGGTHLVVSGLRFRGVALTAGSIVEFRAGSQRLARDCLLTQTALEDCNPPDPATRYNWLTLYGVGNRVTQCAFRGQAHSGVTLCVVPFSEEPARHLIRRNRFGPRAPGRGNGFETIRIGTSDVSISTVGCTVEENLFERCDGETEIISNKSGGNRYLRNTFRECSGCLTLRHGNDCLVDGNVFVGDGARGAGGVRVIGDGHLVIGNLFSGTRGRAGGAISLQAGIPDSPLSGYFQVRGATIAFNTFVDNPGALFDLAAGLGQRGCSLLPEGTLIANNLLMAGAAAEPMIAAGPPTPGVRWHGNLYSGNALGREAPPGLAPCDLPALERDPAGDWRLPAVSPLRKAARIDAALREACARHGIALPEAADVGAVRFPPAGPLWRPLGPSEVGPEWQ